MQEKYLSVFDLDHTLIDGNSGYWFCKYLREKKLVPFSAIGYGFVFSVLYKMGRLSLQQMHEVVFKKFVKGFSLKQLEMHVEHFIEKVFKDKLYRPAIERLEEAKKKGHMTALVSNSPSFMVKAAAKYFGFDLYGATEYAIDEKLNFSHISSLLLGDDKAKFVKKLAHRFAIKRENIAAYSDSIFDLPLLDTVGIPVVVNPDRKLRFVSQRRAWSII